MRLLFDIGATNTRLGVSRDSITLIEKTLFPTPTRFEDGIKEICEHAIQLTGGKKLVCAVGGIAGPLDVEKQEVVSPGNIPGWCKKPLKSALQNVLETDVFLENDTALVGLGEAVFGAGQGYPIVAYITFSSGFGATRIVNGKIDVSRCGFEPAYQIIGYNGRDKTYQPHHYLRFHVSGMRLKNKYGLEPTEIGNDDIWDEVARWAAVGVHNIIVLWSPHCIVFGGPILERLKMERIKLYARNALIAFPTMPLFKRAELGDYGGLYGALQVSRLIKY